jgi:hypothetical protein
MMARVLVCAHKLLGLPEALRHASHIMQPQPEVEGDYLFKLLLVVRFCIARSPLAHRSFNRHEGRLGRGQELHPSQVCALHAPVCSLTWCRFTEDEFEEGGLGATIGATRFVLLCS